MREEYLDELLEQYEAFYLMTRSAALLGTQNSERFDRDAAAVLDFLGQVYGWRQELADAAADLILGPMMRVGLLPDYRALGSTEMLEESVKEHQIFYEIKGETLKETVRSELIDGQHDGRTAQEVKHSISSQAFHHTYEPAVRYARLQARAEAGEPLSTLETALLQILGIGCERDIPCALTLLERSLLWGEKAAAKILAYLWTQEGDAGMVSFFQSVYARLCTPSGPPEEPENAKAAQYCVLIRAVRSAVRRYGGGEIDPLFADLINREGIPFAEKLCWIARYKDGLWLKRYSAGQQTVKIGFLS